MVLNLRSKSRWLVLLTLLSIGALLLLMSRNKTYKTSFIVEDTSLQQINEGIVEETSFQHLNDLNNVTTDENKVLILFWTDYYWIKGKMILDKLIFPVRKWDKNCCTGKAEVTTDKAQLDKATSVVFFGYPDNLKKLI